MDAIFKIAFNFFRAFVGFSIYMVYRICLLCACLFHVIIRKHITKTRQSTEKSARYGRILWKRKHFELDEPSSSDFLCLFSSRVTPDSVLRPNVSLYTLTPDEAIFVETDDKVNIYNSNIHPFVFLAQFKYANSVIKMSITEFVALAEKIGDPVVPVIWVSNTGRCGGTMLGQVFESIPGTLVINEQHPPFNLCHLFQKEVLKGSQYDSILKSIIRVLCRPRQGIARICIKPHPVCTVMMNDITRLMPQIRQIFIYRNSQNTIESWVRTMQSEPFLIVLKACANSDLFSKFCPYFRRLLRYYVISKPKYVGEISDDQNTACLFAYMWSYFIHIARDAMSHDPSILSAKYEDIISRPTETIRQLFEDLNIDDAHVGKAISSMEHDSQRESVLSRNNLSSVVKHLSTVDMIRIDSILSKFNLPTLEKDFRM